MPRPIRTLVQLSEVAEVTRLFQPGGLGGPIPDAESVEYVQRLVMEAELNDAVAKDVRSAFEIAVALHIQGLFQYPFFSVSIVQASLTYELALGLRFVDFYLGRIPLERIQKGRAAEFAAIECSDFGLVAEHLGNSGSHRHRSGWRLVGHPQFNGSLFSLYRWGRDVGVLRPYFDYRWQQREAGIWYAAMSGIPQRPPIPTRPSDFDDWAEEQRIQWWVGVFRPAWELVQVSYHVDLRNSAAHPTIQAIHTPIDSAIALEHLTTFVNFLWPNVGT